MKKSKKPWQPPKAREVHLKEDATSMGCEGKRVGCVAGSSCGSVTFREVAESQRKPKK